MKRAGRVWIRIFPDVPVSKKPAEVRMGSGKGAPLRSPLPPPTPAKTESALANQELAHATGVR